jgi:hypothetical protein
MRTHTHTAFSSSTQLADSFSTTLVATSVWKTTALGGVVEVCNAVRPGKINERNVFCSKLKAFVLLCVRKK